MTIKIIVEQFNIYNNSELDDYDSNLSFRANNDVPKFQIRFYVNSPYFSENINGDIQFSRNIRRKFNEFKALFCKKHGAIYDDPSRIDNSLDLMINTINSLKESLNNSFLIPGEIEIDSIELLGNWEVYHRSDNSELANLFEKQLMDELRKKGIK